MCSFGTWIADCPVGNPSRRGKAIPKSGTLKVPSQGLLSFDGFKEGFEVAFSKALGPLPLDDLKEHRWSGLNRLAE